MEYLLTLFFAAMAILTVTAIATVGAWASRQLRFDYTWLSLGSFLVYAALGFIVSGIMDLPVALLTALAVGFYDGTAGIYLAKRCKPHLPPMIAAFLETTGFSASLTVMLPVSLILALAGYGFRMLLY